MNVSNFFNISFYIAIMFTSNNKNYTSRATSKSTSDIYVTGRQINCTPLGDNEQNKSQIRKIEEKIKKKAKKYYYSQLETIKKLLLNANESTQSEKKLITLCIKDCLSEFNLYYQDLFCSDNIAIPLDKREEFLEYILAAIIDELVDNKYKLVLDNLFDRIEDARDNFYGEDTTICEQFVKDFVIMAVDGALLALFVYARAEIEIFTGFLTSKNTYKTINGNFKDRTLSQFHDFANNSSSDNKQDVNKEADSDFNKLDDIDKIMEVYAENTYKNNNHVNSNLKHLVNAIYYHFNNPTMNTCNADSYFYINEIDTRLNNFEKNSIDHILSILSRNLTGETSKRKIVLDLFVEACIIRELYCVIMNNSDSDAQIVTPIFHVTLENNSVEKLVNTFENIHKKLYNCRKSLQDNPPFINKLSIDLISNLNAASTSYDSHMKYNRQDVKKQSNFLQSKLQKHVTISDKNTTNINEHKKYGKKASETDYKIVIEAFKYLEAFMSKIKEGNMKFQIIISQRMFKKNSFKDFCRLVLNKSKKDVESLFNTHDFKQCYNEAIKHFYSYVYVEIDKQQNDIYSLKLVEIKNWKGFSMSYIKDLEWCED